MEDSYTYKLQRKKYVISKYEGVGRNYKVAKGNLSNLPRKVVL